MGVKTRLVWNNLWRKGTALMPSSEDPQHPATDTQIDTPSMFYRASSKVSPCTVPMTLPAAGGPIDFVAIIGHNIEATGVVITIEGANDAAFTAGVVSRTMNKNNINYLPILR